MNTADDDSSSSLNGRLRPRKSNASTQSNKILRKSDGRNTQEKPKRNCTLTKVSPSKTDDLVDKPENSTIAQLLCPYCDKKFISKQTASKHVHRIHLSSSKQDSLIDCLFCNHAESDSNNIIRHMVDSHPNQYFACLDCHTRLPSTSDLAEHKLNVCEKQKLPYRSKLRQKSSDGKNNLKSLNSDEKDFRNDNKEFLGEHGFNGIVISCELKPTHVPDEADIEDNITTNLILPSGKSITHKAVIEKNAVIVLDDIQWNKRIPSNFSFHNTDADQILSRLGVVHKSPRTGEPAKKDWQKNNDEVTHKFEKCFDTNFYTKVASNVHENLSKYLDGSFNPNADPNSAIKTRKSKNCVAINTAEGFPILLAGEQFSRDLFDGYMPREISPKYKWKWDTPDNDKGLLNADQLKLDSHLNNCIITYVSNLDIWTQLRMRQKFEARFNSTGEKRIEKQNIISKELKEILESREIPTSSKVPLNENNAKVSISGDGSSFPSMLGLTPTIQSREVQPAILSGEWVRPRCYVCCACGAQTRDPRALSTHISSQHPNAYVQHYEIVGESLLDADIFKHLYVPPSQTINRTRPLRGIRECTKCKKTITLEDLHQHMLDCAGDTPTVRRKCRYRPFGVRKRRPRLPDNRIRKKMRKDMQSGQANDKNHLRPRPKSKSEVGDAETIRKMLADLPAKRHRVMINPLNSFPRRKHDRKCNNLIRKKRSHDDRHFVNDNEESSVTESSDSISYYKTNESDLNNDNDEDEDEDDDDLPLKPKVKSSRQKESLNKKATMNRSKRKPAKEMTLTVENSNEAAPVDCSSNSQPLELSIDNTPNRVNVNGGPSNVREHSNRGEDNNRDGQQPGSSRENGNSHNSGPPTQNTVPLKHSIARLTADSETQDKSVQFHRLFLVQQECNNLGQRHLPSDRRLQFENEAIVTKLDKPPLHFNQAHMIDLQNQRKNKSNKPRKRLNDCIAMLKNKLTPNTDDNIPGHVSVQCGSDEPIDQEPYVIEESLNAIKVNEDINEDKVITSQISSQEKQIKNSNDAPTDLDKLDATSKEKNPENEDNILFENDNDFENNQMEKIIITKYKSEPPKPELPKPEPPKSEPPKTEAPKPEPLKPEPLKPESPKPKLPPAASIHLTKVPEKFEIIPEIEITQTDIPLLPLPRNTVIRKSPKTSVNYSTPQEDAKLSLKTTFQAMKHTSSNDCSDQNANTPVKHTDLLPIAAAASEQIVSKLSFKANKVPEEPPKSVESPLANSYRYSQLNMSQSESLGHVSNDIDVSLEITMDYSTSDFHNVSREIPPAHSSTNVESIISTPLDLSGKKSRTSESSCNEENNFSSSYDTYETLDLSNKNQSIDHLPKENRNEIPTDVVVDLSIKSFQSTCEQASRDSVVVDDDNVNLPYENVNIPTDLSVKKNILTSVDLTSQSSEKNVVFVQDLSSHKIKRRENIQEHLFDIKYCDKELPTDLSNDRAQDSPLIIEIIDNDAKSESNDHEPSKERPSQDNMSRQVPHNQVYDNLALKDQIADVHSKKDKKLCSKEQQEKATYTPPLCLQTKTLKAQTIPEVIQPDINKFKQDGIVKKPSRHTESKILEGTRNQSIIPFIENTVIVPQETTKNDAGNGSLPLSNTHINNSSLLPFSKNRIAPIDSTNTVSTLANASICMAKPDTSSSPILTNVSTTLTSSAAAVHSFMETAVSAAVNYIDLSSETDNTQSKKTISSCPESNELYDLTKEEVIDCEVEQDTETARKIAMLPIELVQILGTMPMGHRKRLINILPQYVTPNSNCPEEAANQKSNISTTSLPSPIEQKTLSTKHSYSDTTPNEYLTQNNNNTNYETRSLSRTNMCVTPPSCPIVTQDSIPQSVILKAPVATSDIHQPISKNSNQPYCAKNTTDINRTNSVLSCPTKSISMEEAQDAIIDLTGDENIPDASDAAQLLEKKLSAVTVPLNNVQNLLPAPEPLSHKVNCEQTASLRAVRIKAPSERNKQLVLDSNIESHYQDAVEESNNHTDGHNASTNADHLNQKTVNEPHAVTLTKKGKNKETLDQQLNITTNISSESSVIPALLETIVEVSLDKKTENHTCRNLESGTSTPLNASISTDADVSNISFSVAIADSSNSIESFPVMTHDITTSNDLIENEINSLRKMNEKLPNVEVDSEDDVSLAVIVKQKRREQYKYITNSDLTDINKKRKKSKKSRKMLLENDKEILFRNLSSENTGLDVGKIEAALSDFDVSKEDRAHAEKRKRKAKSRREADLSSPEVFDVTKQVNIPVTFSNVTISDFQHKKCSETITNEKFVNDTSITAADSSCSTSLEFKDYAVPPKTKIDTVDLPTVEHSELVITPEKKGAENLTFIEDEQDNPFKETTKMENKIDNEKFKSKEKYASVRSGRHAHSSEATDHSLETDDHSSIIPSIIYTQKCELNHNAEQQHGASQEQVSDNSLKSKKSRRGRKYKTKNFPERHKSQSLVELETEENKIAPLRRSRRGKSLFIDNTSIETDMANQHDPSFDKKAPFTKKQLIFSKLLLDEENTTKSTIDSVVAKNPIVVINNVDLSSHIYSSEQQTSNTITKNQTILFNISNPTKSSKRKYSPLSKRKIKKRKSLSVAENEKSDTLNNTVNNNKSANNDISHPIIISNNIELVNDDCINDIVEVQNEKLFKYENNHKQNDHYDITKAMSVEKRKNTSDTKNAVDVNCGSLSKKSKFNAITESGPKSNTEDKQSTSRGRGRGRYNYTQSRNKTCYNSNVPFRRTRSKSVVEKSSTSLYDPYDIELEDMVEKNEPYGRRLKSSDNDFNNLSSVKDQEMNKIYTQVGADTDSVNSDTITSQTSNHINSKEEISDSDDSSKSDVPLKKYVEEKEKKLLDSSGNINDECSIASTSNVNHSAKLDTEKEENHNEQISIHNANNKRSEQFMESFGFFSERKPRKSNLIATKKISETFHANETDEGNDDGAQQTAAKEDDEPKQEEENVTVDLATAPSPSKKPGKRGRKNASCTKPLPCYCHICKKEFKRPDNYLRHQMTLLHILKLSEVEMKIKTTPVLEEPNYLLAYKQHLDRLKMLTDKVTKRKKTSKTTSKVAIPSLEEMLANVNKTVREQQLSRRNLSRDEALFIDCCELLKESHKPDISTSENVTITSDVNDIATTSQAPAAESDATSTNEQVSGNRSEGDVDSITAKNILESEEVRILENDLISGLKEAAASSHAQTTNDIDEPPKEDEVRLNQTEDQIEIPKSDEPKQQYGSHEYSETLAEVPSTSKPRKSHEGKDKLYPDVIEPIDMFEDKFDKIKRKCRSQAAAAKQVKPVVELSVSHRGRKKSEKKRGKKSSKIVYQHYAIPTKGALKVFDGIKVSIPTSDINMSGVPYVSENLTKKRKKSNSKKKASKNEIEAKMKYTPDYRAKSTQTQKVDVYEFMDNEDAELFELRPSTLMERFKNINNKDMPSTSKYVPCADKTDFSSESGSDEDDFVYDDYVCSDDETENSLMSCELGNAKLGSESRKSSSSLLKRKDVVEKNAVMGKIFKHNAVRTEKKSSNKSRENPKPKANLDQLFDSLLEDDAGQTITSDKPLNDEFMLPKKHDLSKDCESLTPKKYECLTPRIHESVSQKKHEFTTPSRHESVSPKKHSSSSKKHETSPFKLESGTMKKHDSKISKKHDHDTHRKHHHSSSKKYETDKYETKPQQVPQSENEKRHEAAPSRKHDATSKYNSGKVYPVTSYTKTDFDSSSKKYETSSKRLSFDDKPSSSKKYDSSTNRETFRTSHKKYDSLMYSSSIHEPSTSKLTYKDDHSSKSHDSSTNDYLSSSSKSHVTPTKKYDYSDTHRKYSRDELATTQLDPDSESVSDCGADNVDDAGSDDAGVARQRARRKCTVGKQNVLAETWSSESEPDRGPVRANSAESTVSPISRKRKGRKREGQLYTIRRARQMPIKRQDVEARVALFKRSRSRASSGSGDGSRASSSGLGASSIATSASSVRRPSGSKPRPRSAAYYWSSEGDEEQEHLQQHGWIVGDSHKKLVTMLAHAKGRKRNHDDKRHNIE